MKNLQITFLLLMITFLCVGQSQQNTHIESLQQSDETTRPKLIVGIVVDQMRYDYLTRFESKYGQGGFMRLIGQGYNCKNNHYNYIPTYTGPGHASVFTGTTPKYHGVISNSWYDKVSKETVYCAGDPNVQSVGTEGSVGQMSPHRMIATTFADENRLFTQMRGKTIGISIKDRGAVLPAGHTANAAYWFVGGKEGNFVTSTFYMQKLPQWVEDFNSSNAVEQYMKPWNTLYDISTYTESGVDDNTFEAGFRGKEKATFPYDLEALSVENGHLGILRSTPYGNNIVTDFSLAAIDAENLGQDVFTDVLAISYSSPDYIGHNFGVNSKEVEDTYIRLDKDIERLLNALDAKVGKNEYVVFLTSDHGAVDVPSYLNSVRIPSAYLDNATDRNNFNFFLNTTFGSGELVENVSNNQIFLNYETLKKLKLDVETVQKAIVNELITYPYVEKVYSGTTMRTTGFTTGIEALMQNGYNQKRSGDILVVHQSSVVSYGPTGSTHGSGLNYDTHVPLIFYGKGIKKGHTLKRTEITDIAPTMSALLVISFPNASTGTVLDYVLEH